jgi:acetyltransferase-like isoleucine patch superfamily enzyme
MKDRNALALQRPKTTIRASFNQVLHLLARFLPGGYSLRPFLHRLRGAKIGRGVWIGDDVFLDNAYPEAVEIHDGAAVSMRCTIIGHTKGPGKVVIERGAVIGAGSVVTCTSGHTLTIGECAVVSAGSTVSNDIPPYTLCGPPRIQTYGRVTVPFLEAVTIEEFRRGLRPIKISKENPTHIS